MAVYLRRLLSTEGNQAPPLCQLCAWRRGPASVWHEERTVMLSWGALHAAALQLDAVFLGSAGSFQLQLGAA